MEAPWSVARAFPSASIINSIFGSQRKIYILNEEYLMDLNWRNVFYIFTTEKVFLTFLKKYDVNGTYF